MKHQAITYLYSGLPIGVLAYADKDMKASAFKYLQLVDDPAGIATATVCLRRHAYIRLDTDCLSFVLGKIVKL